MGDVKPWSMGEKPMCFHLVVSMPSSIVNLFNVLILLVGGSYCMRKRGHGEASILAGCCQFRWYTCPAENHRFSQTWSPLFPPLLFFLTRARYLPPLPSSSWSSSCSRAESWSAHAHARGSGAFLMHRSVVVSLHVQGLCIGFSHAGSKRNRGCHLGFSV